MEQVSIIGDYTNAGDIRAEGLDPPLGESTLREQEGCTPPCSSDKGLSTAGDALFVQHWRLRQIIHDLRLLTTGPGAAI